MEGSVPEPEEIDLLPPDVPNLRRLRRRKDTITFLRSFLEWVRDHYDDSGLAGTPDAWDTERAIMRFMRIDPEQIPLEEEAMAAYLSQIQEYLEHSRQVPTLRPADPQDCA